ncbi:TPA: Lpp/OprI family alanine-zipper lipoprotein [Vibrio vulnificus]|uniref:Major outer membrane lipoprotein Lpp n=1 Tax=Vibrio vulnificus TaxID=672 RepID=A0A2S3R086_VIBVL|nr:Lpp/OprI family alanine-zipper lipoprotein [Vibrio vulnificus]MDK2621539.1 Lpp/OprI family alanine-zipper lipoprotein [Vibrio vulnificus]POB45596.1 hypothetical protein CRN52_16615 [Vibrio vulnificus]RAH32246.1 hypothetical protein DOT36_01200 [Vibrio vulnificus]HAU8284358.1 hypothetical protein [Vibrio vulnificus]HDY7675898.1 hypothetical protein [Vibrio vulnificus]
MNKILIAAATSSVLLLAGCASGPDEQTKAAMAQVEDLKNQVDVLTKEMAALKSNQADAEMKAKEAATAAMAAQEEAERANERIDNIAQSYTK